MKTQLIRNSHKVVAGLLAALGMVMCVGTTVVGYEQVASQAAVAAPLAVASLDARRT
ncbi:hypothetical protein OPU71_06345 [Niveibacterium sp. 24ML]|uniref:hypothetical protein n=1 Tax=Niveibacterium sp. 24ML TaxID=2985512 RepID=UPI00226F2C91|nr:hypothetical protein [Niveibacterium sp. 24ML]MCX9155744.1 hypothetical protein [Niveibacterium sp. 24ML]